MKIIISKNASITALIEQADSVLGKYESNGQIPENIKGQAVLSVLKKMTQDKDWFDVSAVNDLAKLNEVTISREHQELFDSMHCIHWRDMGQETKEYLMALMVDYFRFNIVNANNEPS